MKTIFFSRVVLPVCIVLLWQASGCKKDDESISVPPSKNALFVSVSGTGNLNYTQTVIIANTGADTMIKIGADLTVATGEDIHTRLLVDTALVARYNQIYHTQYRLLPATSYRFSLPEKGIMIKAGNDHSVDSAVLTISKDRRLRSKKYLLPVTIQSISGSKNAVISDSTKTVYLLITLADITQTYVSLKNADGSGSQDNTIAITYPFGTTGSSNPLLFNTVLNIPSPYTIQANLAIDNSLITGFNAARGINGIAFPDGTALLSGKSTEIVSGQTQPNSLLNVVIPDIARLDNSKVYVLPVVLKTISGDADADISSNNVLYIQVSFNNINNNDQTASGILINRGGSTPWSITDSASFTTPGSMLDGNYETYWLNSFDGLPASITVDMHQLHTLTTLAYSKAYIGFDIYPTSLTVSTSNDGIHWTNQGAYQPADDPDPNSSPSSPFTNYIRFFNPVQARYFRLTILHSTYYDYLAGISEINAFE